MSDEVENCFKDHDSGVFLLSEFRKEPKTNLKNPIVFADESARFGQASALLLSHFMLAFHVFLLTSSQ